MQHSSEADCYKCWDAFTVVVITVDHLARARNLASNVLICWRPTPCLHHLHQLMVPLWAVRALFQDEYQQFFRLLIQILRFVMHLLFSTKEVSKTRPSHAVNYDWIFKTKSSNEMEKFWPTLVEL